MEKNNIESENKINNKIHQKLSLKNASEYKDKKYILKQIEINSCKNVNFKNEISLKKNNSNFYLESSNIYNKSNSNIKSLIKPKKRIIKHIPGFIFNNEIENVSYAFDKNSISYSPRKKQKFENNYNGSNDITGFFVLHKNNRKNLTDIYISKNANNNSKDNITISQGSNGTGCVTTA